MYCPCAALYRSMWDALYYEVEIKQRLLRYATSGMSGSN